ncbi:MAG: sigma-54 dependent transcriptional regulator [Desulfobacterales bacterium]
MDVKCGTTGRCKMKAPRILITDRGKVLHQSLKAKLPNSGFEIIDTPPQLSPIRTYRANLPDLILLGVGGGSSESQLDLTRQIRRSNKRVPIIFVTNNSSEALAIAAIKAGANDFLKTPILPTDLITSIQRNLAEHPADRGPGRMNPRPKAESYPPMVSVSKAMQGVKEQLLKAAPSDCTVLITGETGTGKELAARALHASSRRSAKPMVCVNCAAIPDSLVESELFGYERGAFTGAVAARKGIFETAADGTVFLDEIGDMTPLAQAKILRCIELKESSRLGSKKGTSLNFRVVAATNRDPEKLITEHRFRKDLYYRLNVARIHIPALRERKEDLPVLVEHFTEQFNGKFGRRIKGFSQEAMGAIFQYDWPGNVRELKNLIEVSFINLPSRQIDTMELPQPLRARLEELKALPKSERDQVIAALCATNWNKSKAAKKLHWSRMTLYRKIAKYNIALHPDPHPETPEI